MEDMKTDVKIFKTSYKGIRKSLDNLSKYGMLNVAFVKIIVAGRQFYQKQSGH